MIYVQASAEKRFWAKVTKTEDEDACWEWKGCTKGRGHGGFNSGDGDTQAHRFSYRLHYGPIPAGLFVLHSCDNPPCTNPRPLFLGTAADNRADCVNKKRHATKLSTRLD